MIYEPEEVKKDFIERADELVFVKDGFSFWAMIAPPIWMIYHRLWWPLIGFFIVLGFLQISTYLLGISPDDGGLLFVGLLIVFGFLANDFRRMMLEYSHYKLIGAVVGHSQLECERRFFDNWSPLMGRSREEAIK
jgi:hypothetical protein